MIGPNITPGSDEYKALGIGTKKGEMKHLVDKQKEEQRKDKMLENYPKNSLNVSKMSFKDCLYLLDWLCGEVGSDEKKSLKRQINDYKPFIILSVILILLLLLLFYQRTNCM